MAPPAFARRTAVAIDQYLLPAEPQHQSLHYMDPHSAYYVDSASKDSVPVLRHADRTLGVRLGVALKAAATNTADLYQLPVPVHTAIVQPQVPVVQLPVPVHTAIVQLPVPMVQLPVPVHTAIVQLPVPVVQLPVPVHRAIVPVSYTHLPSPRD